jgi:hypothetical protein
MTAAHCALAAQDEAYICDAASPAAKVRCVPVQHVPLQEGHQGSQHQLMNNLHARVLQIPITMMTEARMKAKPERVELFEQYKQTTSAWVPWFKSQAGSVKEE